MSPFRQIGPPTDEWSEFVVGRQSLERLRLVGPMEEGQAVIAELHDLNYRIIRSGPYTDGEMHPQCDMTRFLFIAEREAPDIAKPLTFPSEQLDISPLRDLIQSNLVAPIAPIDAEWQTVEELIAFICGDRPNSLTISFNDNWSCYRTAAEEIETIPITDDCFISPEDKQRCLDLNRLWEVHYYPRTQISFLVVYASELRFALEGMVKAMRAEEAR